MFWFLFCLDVAKCTHFVGIDKSEVGLSVRPWNASFPTRSLKILLKVFPPIVDDKKTTSSLARRYNGGALASRFARQARKSGNQTRKIWNNKHLSDQTKQRWKNKQQTKQTRERERKNNNKKSEQETRNWKMQLISSFAHSTNNGAWWCCCRFAKRSTLWIIGWWKWNGMNWNEMGRYAYRNSDRWSTFNLLLTSDET